jgi:hypothetical protein
MTKTLATLLAQAAPATGDAVIPAEAACLLLAKAIEALCKKLDLDATVTDTNYEAIVEAVSL